MARSEWDMTDIPEHDSVDSRVINRAFSNSEVPRRTKVEDQTVFASVPKSPSRISQFTKNILSINFIMVVLSFIILGLILSTNVVTIDTKALSSMIFLMSTGLLLQGWPKQ